MGKSKKQVEAIVSALGVIQSIGSDIVELVQKFGGTKEDIYHLATPRGSEKMSRIAKIIVGKDSKKLQLAFDEREFVIDQCDGSKSLANAQDVFDFIGSGFQELDGRLGFMEIDGIWGPRYLRTEKTIVQVYELVGAGSFPVLYGSLLADLEKLCLTEHQIINFIQKYQSWLKSKVYCLDRDKTYATFFLFKSHGNYCVACVKKDKTSGLSLTKREFGYCETLSHSDYRFVIPKLVE